MIKSCPKLRKGSMSYEFDAENRNVVLKADMPKTGTKGGWFDKKTIVSFEDINAILQEKSVVGTIDFVPLFKSHLGNNSPMLVAAMINEGKLAKKQQGRYNVQSTL